MLGYVLAEWANYAELWGSINGPHLRVQSGPTKSLEHPSVGWRRKGLRHQRDGYVPVQAGLEHTGQQPSSVEPVLCPNAFQRWMN